MEFRLLGAVEIAVDGRVLDSGPPQQRLVMAILAAEAGRPVSAESLIDRVWEEPPEHPRRALQVHLSRLRRLLDGAGSGQAPVRVVRRSGGYLLDVDPDQVDLHRFRSLIGQARGRECPRPQRAALLGRALALWRGLPLADLPGPWATRVRHGLQEQYLDAVAVWAEESVRAGDPGAVLARLGELVGEHPLAESLGSAYMRALYAAGRPADALHHYTVIRHRLAEELGTDPGPELQQLHRQVLTADSALTPPEPPEPAAAARLVPRQLPAPPQGFTGRATELAALDQVHDASTVVITAISGMAGVGKTALAMHWAHRVADRFPDGQLYVNLRGFDPSGAVMDPAGAVRGFLDALAVPPQRIPADPQAQAGLYRSLLAGRRMLIVLDNARDAEQVRPLLPGAPGCLVLVTSRNQLSSLVAVEGAHPLILDVLTTDEARQLLAARLGPRRISAETQATQEVIAQCARLPLALAIVAARAATYPDFPLAALASELKDTHHRLDVLAGQDPTTDVRAVFSWSYHTLTHNAARLFRLLGLHPGPHFTPPAAASLAGVAPDAARAIVAELTRTHLITEYAPGRYTIHDLLRTYATDLAHRTDNHEQRHAATGRMLDHYLHTAYTADRLLYPGRDPIALSPPRPGATPERLTDHPQALGWFTAEHRVLLATIDHAFATGFDTHTWQLAWTLSTFLDRQGHWHDLVSTGRAAITAGQRLADPTAQARACHSLGSAYMRLERFEEADAQLHRALDLATRAGDQTGQARIHHSLGYLRERWGRPVEALDHAQQALQLYQAAGHQVGQARALNAVGWCHALLGDRLQALTCCQRALTLHQHLGDRYGQAAAWDSLGYAHHHLGHHTQATTCYQRALTLYQDLGNRYNEADTLDHLGDTHHAAGNPEAARTAWQQALAILDDLDHPNSDRIRAKLNQPPEPGCPGGAA